MSCTSSPRDVGDDTLSVLFTGDVLLDRGARPVIERRGIGYLLQEVEPYFRQADAVVVNLECPLTDSLSPLNKQYIFRADASWAADLYRTGITHAALANNHTIDQGRRGLQATWQHLVEADIVPLGYGCSAEEQLEPAVVRPRSFPMPSADTVRRIPKRPSSWCSIGGRSFRRSPQCPSADWPVAWPMPVPTPS